MRLIVRVGIGMLPAFVLWTAESVYRDPRVIATVNIPELSESSGISASRRTPGIYWSHNDSGGDPVIYAFDDTGRRKGVWRVEGARNLDWEDMAAGPGPKRDVPYLYIGDIGDNNRERTEVTIYRFEEPATESAHSDSLQADPLRFRYPDGPHDAEALLVHPSSGDVYIIAKARGSDTQTSVYKAAAPLRPGTVEVLRRVAELQLPNESALSLLLGLITGGDISPDGRRVILCDYFRGLEAVLPAGEENFDAIWNQEWNEVDLGKRIQGEAVCYRLDGRAVVVTSEGSPFPLIQTERY